MRRKHTLIRVGVEDSATLPIRLAPGLTILSCESLNRAVATCAHTRTTVTVTGESPGVAKIRVVVGDAACRPLKQLVFAVQVVEEDEE